jgi:hypothetical protein
MTMNWSYLSRLAKLNIIPVAWLILYPVLVLFAHFTAGNSSAQGVPAPPSGSNLGLLDIVMAVLPWFVPAVVFGRRSDGSRYYSTTSILVWAAVPVLLFVGISMTQMVWTQQASVVRSTAILLTAVTGWAFMILWWFTFGLWGKKTAR